MLTVAKLNPVSNSIKSEVFGLQRFLNVALIAGLSLSINEVEHPIRSKIGVIAYRN
jgi:hypothetical protein